MSTDELTERVRALRAEGRSPKEIARALGVRPSAIAGLVRAVAQERANALRPVAACLVSPGWSKGLTIDGHEDWPRSDSATAGAGGLASVLVAREHRHGSVSVCGYLVDVYCLGVKDALGPRVMKMHELAGFSRLYFEPFQAPPLAAPIELVRELVLGAVEYARDLGFAPHPDFEAARAHLGPWEGPSAIRFGRDGKPLFIQGSRDDPDAVVRTLERTVGRGNFEFCIPLF